MALPAKTREMHSFQFDSTVWNELKHRSDDIVIATYAKSGTTWMQQIVSQLIFAGAEDLPVARMSPWLERRQLNMQEKLGPLEAQDHRRFIKTHLPRDAIPFNPDVKYIFVARDGRDVVWSLHQHHMNSKDEWYELVNNTPGLVGPPIDKPKQDTREYFIEWLEKDGFPWNSFWEMIRTWWEVRDFPNVHVSHFADLRSDLAGEILKVAAFLEIDHTKETLAKIFENCTFAYMKKSALKTVPGEGIYFKGGAKSFMHKGTNERWRGALSKNEISWYEKTAIEKLGADCARWLARH